MPEWTREPTPTTGTLPHRQLREALDSLGFYVEDEVAVGIYRVDCYVSELHLAFEADGPHHSERRDVARDARILTEWALPTCRLRSLVLGDSGASQALLRAFVDKWRDSTARRTAFAHDKGWNR